MYNIIKQKIVHALSDMNYILEEDVLQALKDASQRESSDKGKKVLQRIMQNIEIARQDKIPLCQDTGLVWFYIQAGKDFPLKFSLDECLDEAVYKAYTEGYFRFSIVEDPLQDRKNTKTNTPSVKYYDFKEGSDLTVSILVKGFGSENMSHTAMLEPNAGEKGVRDFIRQTVRQAGGSPCPPIFLGIGIGGTMDLAALMSKKALFRKVGKKHENRYYAELEKNIMKDVNSLGIGPAGIGGDYTCLNAAIEYYPTHIAGLPVAVSINCWADRKAVLHFTASGESTLL